MQRITRQDQAEAISAALTCIPAPLGKLFVRTGWAEFFCADPILAGLHSHEKTVDGRSYRDTAHTSYGDGGNQDHLSLLRRRNTIVLPPADDWNFSTAAIVHEIGHILHWLFGFEDFEIPQVSEYARLNHRETFAEAFMAYCWQDFPRYAEPWLGLHLLDREWMRFFDHLVTGVEDLGLV